MSNIKMQNQKISVVTPTLHRPEQIRELLLNLADQTCLPYELIVVDGAPDSSETKNVIESAILQQPYQIKYVRHGGGTAIQRNVGIDCAQGNFIAFIDDDIRLASSFFETIISVFHNDQKGDTGGVVGYITNQSGDINSNRRWQLMKRLHLFSIYEPGRYDYQAGYPINRYLQAPYTGTKIMDFLSSNCAVWRREVFTKGLRFSEFFKDYGVLEDAHFSLRAGKEWKLLECGDAKCQHFHASGGRSSPRIVAQKTAINYRYVFMDIVPHRTLKQDLRFWLVQFFYLLQFSFHALRYPSKNSWLTVLGKVEGIFQAMRMKPQGRQ